MKWWMVLLFLLQSLCALQAQPPTDYLIRVIDVEQEALAGATLTCLPLLTRYITDADGQALISVADSLEIRYLGFPTQVITWEELLAAEGQIQMAASIMLLPSIIVSDKVGRRDLSQAKISVGALAIQRAQVNTTAEALASEAGVFIQQSQLGGGSPIVRGFEANRVLLVVDDIRMNNAIYRSGHLQNAITVDENILSNIELSYGPGSLPYGSDALGGVVHFKTKDPQPIASLPTGQIRWNGQVGIRYSSAGNNQSGSAQLVCQSRRWSGITAVSASKFGDLRAGDNRPVAFPTFGLREHVVETVNGVDQVIPNEAPNRQLGSGYQQLDILQKVNVNLSTDWRLQLNLQYSNTNDIPRYDRLTERRNGQFRFAEWYYGPQQRLLAAAKLDWHSKSHWADRARLIISRQWIAEDRYDRSFGSQWREASLVDVAVNNLTLDMTKRWQMEHRLNYGIDARYDGVASVAFSQNILSGVQLPDVNSRYPSQGSSLASVGAYVQYRYTNRDSSLLIESGGRINEQQLQVQFGANDPIEWPWAYLLGIKNNSTAATWASGISWQMHPWALRAHLASGFRTPNVDDFAKFRERNGFIQVPNPDLKAEQSLSADFTIARWLGKTAKVSATVYRTWLRNAIVRSNFQLPNGDDFFLNRGDTLFVQANINAEQARVWGLDMAAEWKFGHHFSAKVQWSYTHGRRDFQLDKTTIIVPLGHIPPAHGQARIGYTKTKWEASAHWQFQAQKHLKNYAVSSANNANDNLVFDRTGTSDNLEQTPFDAITQTYAGSYAWSVFHLRASYKIGKQLRLRGQLNNIFDRHYRPFASGISAPGRDIVLGVYGYF